MLEDRYPGVDFEVVSAAITAINSHVVLPIARECSELDPDLFIVYLGNNEVVGPYGAGTVFAPMSSNRTMIELGIAFRKTRTGQLANACLRKLAPGVSGGPKTSRGMEMFLDKQIRASDPSLQTVYENFRENLVDICRAGQKAGVPVLLCTVGVNLKDCAPLASMHKPGVPRAEQELWEQYYSDGAALENAGYWAKALDPFRQATVIDDEYADLLFRIARCYYESESYRQAKKYYSNARDMDTLRFRADTRINEIIREAAESMADGGVVLVDTAKALSDESPHGIPDRNQFYEHVHLNFAGNYVVAEQLSKQIDKELAERLQASPPAKPILRRQECEKRLAYTDWDRYKSAEITESRLRRPPFTEQLDHEKVLEWWQDQMKRLEKCKSDKSRLSAINASYEQALTDRPEDWLLHARYAQFLIEVRQNDKEAAKHLRLYLNNMPQSFEARFDYGEALMYQGRYAEAENCFEKMRTANPYSSRPLTNLGILAKEKGDIDKAVQILRKAVEVAPQDPKAYFNLANSVLAKGKTDSCYRQEARELYARAIELDPHLEEARWNLAKLYFEDAMKAGQAGDDDRARELLERTVETKPDFAEAQRKLGLMCYKSGDKQCAADHLVELLRLEPDDEEMRELAVGLCYNLAQQHAEKDEFRQAGQYLQKLVEIKPDHAEAHLKLASILRDDGLLDPAIYHFSEVLRIEPDNQDARQPLAKALCDKAIDLGNQNNPRDAMQALRKSIELDPELVEAHIRLALILKHFGKHDEALEHARKAVKLEPENARAEQVLEQIKAPAYRPFWDR